MYEARQNKEIVNRRIDAAGGRTRQRVRTVDKRKKNPIQKNKLKIIAPCAKKTLQLQKDAEKFNSLKIKFHNVLKHAKALLNTDKSNFDSYDKILEMRKLMELAEERFKSYTEESILFDDVINISLIDEPIYIQSNLICIQSKFEEYEDEVQVRLLFDLLTNDRNVPDEIFVFIENSLPKFKNEENIYLYSGYKVFRLLKAENAFRYISDGINPIKNKWAELGYGLYTSPDFEGAEIYDSADDFNVIIEMDLKQDANGMVCTQTQKIDEKSEEIIEAMFGYFDCITDANISQIKFHKRFYQTNLEIMKIFAKNKKGEWTEEYDVNSFVKEYMHLYISKHKSASENNFKTNNYKQKSIYNKVAPKWISETNRIDSITNRILYTDMALKFERRLGDFLSTYQPAIDEVTKLVKNLWDILDVTQRKKLGTNDPKTAGMVGNYLMLLHDVVENGNLREKFTLLYNGYKTNVLGHFKRPKEFDRKEREQISENAKPIFHPLNLHLPLSDREWFRAVDKHGELLWTSGESIFHYKMSSKYQRESEKLLRPVSTGISGTAYGILQMANSISEKINSTIDIKYIRLGLLGWMLPTRDHTFYEIMEACRLFNPNELNFNEGFLRYKFISPLSTNFLRINIAEKGIFPDEILIF